MLLDWDNLRFFLAVARHRTLAGAAKHLHVTQSTVSRRIAAMQEDMGVRLLQRTPGDRRKFGGAAANWLLSRLFSGRG